MKKLGMLLLLLCFCALAAANVAPWEVMPHTRPKADIWIEGEEYVCARGGTIAADFYCYGGGSWELLTRLDPLVLENMLVLHLHIA